MICKPNGLANTFDNVVPPIELLHRSQPNNICSILLSFLLRRGLYDHSPCILALLISLSDFSLSLNNVNTNGAFGLVLAYLLLLCFLRGISSPWSFPWSLYIKCLFFSLFHSTPWRDPRHRLEGNLGDIMILLGEAALPRVGVDS